MSQPARGLGKGLSAILGNVPGADELRGKPEVSVPVSGRTPADVLMIPLGEIEPNPYQPRQTFDRAKLDKAIRRACGKRKVSDEQIRGIIDRVVANIDGDEVQSATIAELVMGELHKVDEVAYIRFASVYRQFKDVAQFLAAITEIVKK